LGFPGQALTRPNTVLWLGANGKALLRLRQ
jgi:hypothetical protein